MLVRNDTPAFKDKLESLGTMIVKCDDRSDESNTEEEDKSLASQNE